MDLFIILLALGLLMFIAYRGFSVILFAPICALFAVFLTEPTHILPFFSNIFMEKMVGFVKLYFPVFLLGALFGKIVEMSGIAKTVAQVIIHWVGPKRAILATVLLSSVLTYSGVSIFVVAFALYPLASNIFRESNIPRRLIPATIVLGGGTYTVDALPGTPQIQNVIPTTFFKTDIYAAPILGIIGATFIFTVGMIYLEWRRRKAQKNGEGYFGFGDVHSELAAAAEPIEEISLADSNPSAEHNRQMLAFIPLILVGLANKFFTVMIPKWYPDGFDFASIGLASFGKIDTAGVLGVWSVEIALLIGIIAAILYNRNVVMTNFQVGINTAVAGALLATMNTASEYGFGGIISSLPGFGMVRDAISHTFTNPLVNGAVTTNILSGMTGSASGGMGIVLSSMGEQYLQTASAMNIPPEVMHRVIAMASGGMDTLPHNGAIITILTVCALTHRQSYGDIFAITILKTFAAFLLIAVYSLTGIV